ncbi:MAG TPA: tRNA (adenosine(37)-N6)-threonylcarbamoyltransferase complex dimerization subunit type 1 TsaB [Candidatus Saccharimonadales bacterium]|nr:tRNA (adenosine(37)-N6)-threonylcarbamoyltransferase complex dimerization subunit type 1 TsaB [Candidatus Saccharimonadales bacterium]
MQPYIILQYPYETIQVALCSHGKILTKVQEHKFNAIALTIPHIDSMLKTHNIALKDLQCIGVNVGPGPYNTLRALLTMANGIHFASGLPLVGLSALDLLSDEYSDCNTLVIFQAFADHVFYQFKMQEKKERGACSIDELIRIIANNEFLNTGSRTCPPKFSTSLDTSPTRSGTLGTNDNLARTNEGWISGMTKEESFLALGNGAQLYQKKLVEAVGDKLIFPDIIPAFNSLETIAQKTFEKIEANQFETGYLKPIYFEDLTKN